MTPLLESKRKMPLPTLDECKPGFQPVEYNVVVAAEETEEVRKSGLIIPLNIKDKDDTASMIGRLVAVSPLAFNYDNWPDDQDKPAPGARVLFAKYAGVLVDGADQRQYRVFKDKDVMAVFDV